MGATAQSGLRSDGFQKGIDWATPVDADAVKAQILNIYAVTQCRLLQQAHLYFGWAAAAATSKPLLQEVVRLLGNDIAIQSTFIVIKPPKTDFEIPPHQDGINTNLELDPDRSVSAWLAITDCRPDNGCLRVFPKSHLQGYKPFEVGPLKPTSISGGRPTELSQTSGIGDPVNVELQKGQSFLMHVALVHDSKPNSSDDFRIGFNIRFVTKGAFNKYTNKVPDLLIAHGEGEGGAFPLPVSAYCLAAA